MRKISRSCSFVCLILLFSACSSSPVHVPGETRVILKNLATEYYNVAEGYMELKKYDKAAEYYALAMRDKDLYMSACYKLARSYALARDWDKAWESYETLLEHDKENSVLRASLAYITAMRGDTDGAIVRYRALLDESPYDESLLESYVALLINAGRGEDAREYFFVLKEKFPGSGRITTFSQKLSEILDDFDPERNPDE